MGNELEKEKIMAAETVLSLEDEWKAKYQKEYEEKFNAWKAKELAELKETQDKQIQEEIGKLYKKIQDETKPPTKEEIQKLVEQEYAEIPVKLYLEGEYQTFILRELPQAIERKFYRQFQQRLKDKGSELLAYTQRNIDKPFEEQLNAFMETFDGAFDVISDAVALILNPYQKDAKITSEWCANNISSDRMYNIIRAQVEVNRLRDFFSQLFQSGQRAGTILTPLSMNRLRQLVR